MLLIAGIGSVGAASDALGVWSNDARATKFGTRAQCVSVVALLILTAIGAHQSEAPGGAMLAGAGALGCIAYPVARKLDRVGEGWDGLAQWGLRLAGLFFALVAAQSSKNQVAWALPALSFGSAAYIRFA